MAVSATVNSHNKQGENSINFINKSFVLLSYSYFHIVNCLPDINAMKTLLSRASVYHQRERLDS